MRNFEANVQKVCVVYLSHTKTCKNAFLIYTWICIRRYISPTTKAWKMMWICKGHSFEYRGWRRNKLKKTWRCGNIMQVWRTGKNRGQRLDILHLKSNLRQTTTNKNKTWPLHTHVTHFIVCLHKGFVNKERREDL